MTIDYKIKISKTFPEKAGMERCGGSCGGSCSSEPAVVPQTYAPKPTV
jgi:hypothetical protein